MIHKLPWTLLLSLCKTPVGALIGPTCTASALAIGKAVAVPAGLPLVSDAATGHVPVWKTTTLCSGPRSDAAEGQLQLSSPVR